MCLHPSALDQFVSGSIHRTGAWEGDMVARMISTMRNHSNSTLLDIGGNVGYWALAASTAGQSVDVFEPVPLSAAMIQQSIARNGLRTIRLHTVALGAHAHEVGMGRSAVNQGGVRHGVDVESPTLLPTMSLDTILEPESRPVYIKIDVEGGECDALRGMKRYVEHARNIIGVSMEFGQSREVCCEDWVQDGGFFDILHLRHRLCPDGVSLSAVCESSLWDLTWRPC